MPRFYCEYCEIFLTHSSAHGRRQHSSGRKHIMNVIDYYANFQLQVREGGGGLAPGMSSLPQPLPAPGGGAHMFSLPAPPPLPMAPPRPMAPMQPGYGYAPQMQSCGPPMQQYAPPMQHMMGQPPSCHPQMQYAPMGAGPPMMGGGGPPMMGGGGGASQGGLAALFGVGAPPPRY